MRNYYINTCGQLCEIFSEHCNLSMEQYEVISGRMIDLLAEVQEMDGEGTWEEAQRKTKELNVIFEFLLETKEITLEEYNELCNLAGTIEAEAERARDEQAAKGAKA